MKIKRTLFSCLMTLALVCVCLLILPTEAQAASVDDLDFSFNELHQEYAVSLCDSDASGNLEIPATYNGYPVTSIEGSAFSHCAGLTSVTIPDSITYISGFAFYDCPGLISVHIGDGIHTLTMAVFDGCSNLSSVTIGSGVKVIGQYAFRNCPTITEVYYNGTEEQWNAISVLDGNDILSEATICFLADFTYSVTDDEATITGYTGNGGNVLIPSELGGYPVKTIGNSAFYGCESLSSITIPDSVNTIGEIAFGECRSLTSVTIPDSVTTIGVGPFYYCTNLISVTISDNITSIVDNMFRDCRSLTNVTIPDSVNTIGEYAFFGCSSLTSITIPDSVATIGQWAFGTDFKLANVTIGNGITAIGSATFRDCHSLTNVTIPNSVRTIDDYAFYNCFNLTDVYYGGNKAQKGNIAISTENDPLLNATWHYAPCKIHTYTHSWDSTCNICGATRAISSAKAPTSFKATLSGHDDVKMSWKKVSGATHYYVYYRRAGKADWKRAGITTGLTYTIKDLVANGKYEFKVISYLKDSSGTYKGASTKVLTCSTTRNLKAPSKVTVKLYGYDDVKISWSKVTYAKGYKVYYKRSTAKSYSYVGFTPGTSIKKANLSDGVKYTFKVVPCTKVNGSYFADDSSKTASITTLKTVSTPKVAKYTSSKVKVSWTDIAGESGYQVIVTSDKAGRKKVTTATTTGKSKTLSAKKGKTYYYKVRAYKTVDGKRIYAPWSAVKAYKLK